MTIVDQPASPAPERQVTGAARSSSKSHCAPQVRCMLNVVKKKLPGELLCHRFESLKLQARTRMSCGKQQASRNPPGPRHRTSMSQAKTKNLSGAPRLILMTIPCEICLFHAWRGKDRYQRDTSSHGLVPWSREPENPSVTCNRQEVVSRWECPWTT